MYIFADFVNIRRLKTVPKDNHNYSTHILVANLQIDRSLAMREIYFYFDRITFILA